MEPKGQSAFEFMFIFGVLLSTVVFCLWVSMAKTGEVAQAGRQLEIDDFLTTVSEKINTAWVEGEGFSSNITMPDRVAGGEYELNISAGTITLFIGEEYYVKQVIATNVTGIPAKGATSTLRNTGTGITVTPA